MEQDKVTLRPSPDSGDHGWHPDPNDVRTEYSALTRYYERMTTFRFTTLGFYLAAIGLIVSRGASAGGSFLLLVISIVLWLIELRSHSILLNLADRAMQIERDLWHYPDDRNYDPFFCHMYKTTPGKSAASYASNRSAWDKVTLWGIDLTSVASHSIALNLLYFVVCLYALISFIF